MSIQIFNYEGSQIQFDMVNGQLMANATLMCDAFDSRPNDWLNLKGTKRYIEAITKKNGSDENQLITTVNGGEKPGTWINEKLILNLARWLNVDFEVWCDDKIAELLRTGKVELKPMSIEEMMISQLQGMIEAKKELKEIKEDIKLLKAKQNTSEDNYFTIAGYGSLHGLKINKDTANIAGRKAVKLCKELGYIIGKVTDAKYGSINTYPIDVIESVLKEINN